MAAVGSSYVMGGALSKKLSGSQSRRANERQKASQERLKIKKKRLNDIGSGEGE
jgi:hypothetical protein